MITFGLEAEIRLRETYFLEKCYTGFCIPRRTKIDFKNKKVLCRNPQLQRQPFSLLSSPEADQSGVQGQEPGWVAICSATEELGNFGDKPTKVRYVEVFESRMYGRRYRLACACVRHVPDLMPAKGSAGETRHVCLQASVRSSNTYIQLSRFTRSGGS